MQKKSIRCCIFFISSFLSLQSMALPTGFVYLKAIDPSIIQDMRYVTRNNFVGRPIHGYQSSECILSKESAVALSKVQQALRKKSLGLKVYDCYRPQSAVDDFIAWSKNHKNQKMKMSYYPRVDKVNFFELGYVAAKSSHTRGSTVDLTIVHLTPNKKPKELYMGTHFDFMDEKSHPTATDIPKQARFNRALLQSVMLAEGFKPLDTEWWHFTLRDEPYPDAYFNFPVK